MTVLRLCGNGYLGLWINPMMVLYSDSKSAKSQRAGIKGKCCVLKALLDDSSQWL
jgi:hypothetical protein